MILKTWLSDGTISMVPFINSEPEENLPIRSRCFIINLYIFHECENTGEVKEFGEILQ